MSSKEPTDLACFIFQERERRYGEPDLLFEPMRPASKGSVQNPPEVYFWKAEKGCDLNTFATLGLVNTPFKDAGFRAEIEWSIHGNITQEEGTSVAVLLANLACFPNQTGRALDVWHVIPVSSPIPLFPSCKWILLHPAFSDEGWEFSVYPPENLMVKILRVIPITDSEKQLMMDEGIPQLMRYFREFKIDFFKPR
jgi:hypothetical protein